MKLFKSITLTFYRTTMLLGVGLGLFIIITPLLQITLAYIYFKKNHIWHNVLNAYLEKDASYCSPYKWFNTAKNLIMGRFMY